MKRRLNIFCLMIFVVLCYSLYMSFYQFGSGFVTGLNLAKGEKEKMKANQTSLFQSDFRLIDVVPEGALWKPDSVLNAKTGKQVPMMHSQMVVRVNEQMNVSQLVVNAACAIINILLMIAAVVFFVLLMLNINNSRIFEWQNVKFLRFLGRLLTLSFVADLIPQILNYSDLKALFALENYMISPFEAKVTNLLLGIACLIVAEIFAIGLRLKEEQDLTI